jgi:hypothetical protein
LHCVAFVLGNDADNHLRGPLAHDDLIRSLVRCDLPTGGNLKIVPALGVVMGCVGAGGKGKNENRKGDGQPDAKSGATLVGSIRNAHVNLTFKSGSVHSVREECRKVPQRYSGHELT